MNIVENNASSFTQPEIETFGRFLILTLPRVINEDVILTAKASLTHQLYSNKETNAVVFGLAKVAHADRDDLEVLSKALSEIRLMGAQVGIFGLNPGLAVLIVRSKIDLELQAAGCDLEDIIHRLSR